MKKGKLVILSAPSGSGKTTICKKLLKNNKNWHFSISATTRPIRDNEVNGKDYLFMNKEKFEHKEKFGEFVESQWVHGNRYGTLYEPIEECIDTGKTILLDVDVKGAMNLIEEFPDDSVSIFIEPPGFDAQEKIENLRERMENRGSSNETLIKQRLKRFDLEITYKEKFNFTFVNDNLEKTTDKIEKIIKENI